jgi:hypothetical protein
VLPEVFWLAVALLESILGVLVPDDDLVNSVLFGVEEADTPAPAVVAVFFLL